MPSKQTEALDASKGHEGGSLPQFQGNQAAKTANAWKDLAFGAKLFGIAGLIVLLLWVLDKYV